MAVTALQRQSEDEIIRQAYQRRKDEIYFNNLNIQRAEQAERKNEFLQEEIEQLRQQMAVTALQRQSEDEIYLNNLNVQRAEQAERKVEFLQEENEQLRQQLAAFQSKPK